MVKHKLKSTLRWLALPLLLLLVVLALVQPLPRNFSGLVLGTPSNDLFDEITIHQTICSNLLAHRNILFSQALDFPIERNLLITHKSFLHIFFDMPFMLALDWPQWWNAAVIAALFFSAWAAGFTLIKLGRHYALGLALGASFLTWQWLRELASWGHLVQMWAAPLYLAIFFLVAALTRQHNGKACWGLTIFSIVTAFVYWIWGGCLALLGLLALGFYWRQLSQASWIKLLISVAVIAAVVLPAAHYVISINPNLPSVQQGGGLDDEGKKLALQRAASNSFLRSEGEQKAVLPGAALVAPAMVLGCLGLLALAYRRHSELSFWCASAAIFFTIGCGPYLTLGACTLTDSAGLPVKLPLFYLMDWTGLGYRWQTPNTVMPFMMISLALAVMLAWQPGSKGKSMGRLSLAALLSVALLAPSVLGSEGVGMGNTPRSQDPSLPGQPLQTFFPMFSFQAPPAVQALRQLPEGALLEFPLGYCCNSWQLQHLHGRTTCHGRHPIASVMEKNAFVLWLYRRTRYACEGLPLNYIPDAQAAELPYGTKELPEHLIFHSNRYPILNRTIDRFLVVTGFDTLYDLGVRYAVLHKANCEWLAPGHGAEACIRLGEMLHSILGQAIYSDNDIVVYRFDTPEQMTVKWDHQPWRETLAVPPADLLEEAPVRSPITE